MMKKISIKIKGWISILNVIYKEFGGLDPGGRRHAVATQAKNGF